MDREQSDEINRRMQQHAIESIKNAKIKKNVKSKQEILNQIKNIQNDMTELTTDELDIKYSEFKQEYKMLYTKIINKEMDFNILNKLFDSRNSVLSGKTSNLRGFQNFGERLLKKN